MLNQRKFSVFQMIMIVITILYIISRISGIINIVQMSTMPVLGRLLIVFFIQVAFLVMLILLPRNLRVLAIIPLLYFTTSAGVELITFISNHSILYFPTGFIIETIFTKILYIATYTVYIVLLLPMIQYQKKHIFIAGSFVIFFYILYLISIFSNLPYLLNGGSIFLFMFRLVLLNFIIVLAIPVVFTLYVLDDYKKQNIVNEIQT